MIKRVDIPFVLVMRTYPKLTKDAVITDDYHGAYEAVSVARGMGRTLHTPVVIVRITASFVSFGYVRINEHKRNIHLFDHLPQRAAGNLPPPSSTKFRSTASTKAAR